MEQVITHDEAIASQNDDKTPSQDDDIFRTEEIKIEEMAIDGICGVY